MKRFLCLILLLLFASAPAGAAVRASAQTESFYAVAAAKDVGFYAQPSDPEPLFFLPYTYYVKVVSQEGDFFAAEYLENRAPYRKISGYCRADRLTAVDFVPVRPYLYREVTVSYSLPVSAPSLGNGSFQTVERDFVYYGARYAEDGMYFYVCREGVFDYIPATEELTYDLNTDYLPDSADTTAGGGAKLSGAQIAVLCFACAAAVALAAFVLRGKKSPSVRSEF